jgi:curved DNA-binding protein CbpA
MKNYYEILEVNKKASQEVIEKAYRVLVKKYHPDLYVGEKRSYAEQKTKDINEAYKILSDTFLKEQYDVELEKELEQEKQYKNMQNTRNYKEQEKEEKETSQNEETEKTTELGNAVKLVKILIENLKIRKNKNEKKEITKEDITAAVITLVIVIVLGVILWFIPVTKGFIRSLIPF